MYASSLNTGYDNTWHLARLASSAVWRSFCVKISSFMAGQQAFVRNTRSRLEGLSDLLLRGEGTEENVQYRLVSLCRDVLR